MNIFIVGFGWMELQQIMINLYPQPITNSNNDKIISSILACSPNYRKWARRMVLIWQGYSKGSEQKAMIVFLTLFWIVNIIFTMEKIQQYDPLKWPPSLQLAELHLKCVCPGQDNINGIECPCCGRYEKVKLRNWLWRSVLKDFKNYGGAIPGYVELVKYCWVVFTLVTLIVVLYHIYAIQVVCPLIHLKYENNLQLLDQYRCQTFLMIFKVCDPILIFNILQEYGYHVMSSILFGLQIFSFFFLIAATIGMKLWLQRVNFNEIEQQEKVYSYFSLILKNIPKFYQIDNIKHELEEMHPGVKIVEVFFIYQMAELETEYRKLFDLYYEILYMKDSVATSRGQTMENLNKKIEEYIKLYEKVRELKKKIGSNNGKAIVVFNSYQERNEIYKILHVNECRKFIYHTCKLFGYNTMNLHFFADKLLEPHEINWKFIGESSERKNELKIVTSLLGLGFVVICFLLFYFPMIKIRQLSTENHSILITIVSIFISLVLQILAIVYRLFILRIIPIRQPSTREGQSYFIIMTTVIFHFLFYLLVPGTYYQISVKIPNNIKLKQVFIAVLTFLVMTIIVGFYNMRYRLFNGRRKKIMGSYAGWGKFCQMRLHEEIRWPSFPIEYKVMVILNIWSFNAFYSFQVPYLNFFFLITLSIIFMIDKKIIYTHYKMQVFQSIEALISVQRDYLPIFLLCLCFGYAICSIYIWQYILAGVMFVVSLVINGIISVSANRKEEKRFRDKSMTLTDALKGMDHSFDKSFISNLITHDIKDHLLVVDNVSTVSLGSAIFESGYRQLYDNYLHQFRSHAINDLLQKCYEKVTKEGYNVEEEINEMKKMNYDSDNGCRVSEMKVVDKSFMSKSNVSNNSAKSIKEMKVLREDSRQL